MKKFTITNHTFDVLFIQSGAPQEGEHQVLLPSLSITTRLSKSCRALTLSTQSSYKQAYDYEKDWLLVPYAFTIRLPKSQQAAWRVVKVADNCPWIIYRSRISRKHHRLLILPRRNLSSYLSEIPDSVPLCSLLLPGTHDTMAFFGWPISQCQSLATPLSVQLHSGIRILDVRLAVIDSRLIAYHGLYPERAPFQEILSDLREFLSAQLTCRETIVMSIKQEDFTSTSPVLFSQLVHDEIMNGPGGRAMWFLENRIPGLGEVRGKIVMFSRFGGDGSGWEGGIEGLGIHPTAWPDSAKDGFSWQCKDTLVRTHDWYNIPSFLSIPEKTDLSIQVLLPPPTDRNPTLSITYFSASSFPLAFPPTVARGFGWPKWGLGIEGVNGRVGQWLIDVLSGEQPSGKACKALWSGSSGHEKAHAEARLRGWAFMDFFKDPEDNAIVPLLVECNFRGRKAGEEGWL